MSHHLDSALSRKDVRLNITDLYAFRGQTGTVLVLDVNTSAAGETDRKGFHPEARYEFKIDLNGDAVEDLTYRASFGPADALGRQSIELRRLDGSDARSDATPGTLVASGATGTDIRGDRGLRLWAGQAADPFYIDPELLGAASKAFSSSTRADLSSWQADKAADIFSTTTVYAIVLEIPDAELAPGRSIGVWSVSQLATDAGGWRQINRFGHPMIQPIFNGDGAEPASLFNTTRPSDDVQNYRERFVKTVAAVVEAYATSDSPRTYAEGLADLLLPDLLPYRVGSQATYGFAVRNGRALTDNAVEVTYSLATNRAFPVGLDRRNSPAMPGGGFPYVAAAVFEDARVPAAAV